MKHPTSILAVQSYGRISGTNDRSSGARGSIGRIRHAVELIEAGIISRDSYAVFPQGYSKGDPTGFRMDTRQKYSHPLCHGMALELKRQMQARGYEISTYAQPLTWGTMNDVIETVKIAMNFLEADKPIVHFVSDPVHIRRVRLVWDYIQPKCWTGQFHSTPYHTLTAKERVLREPHARIWYRFMLYSQQFSIGV